MIGAQGTPVLRRGGAAGVGGLDKGHLHSTRFPAGGGTAAARAPPAAAEAAAAVMAPPPQPPPPSTVTTTITAGASPLQPVVTLMHTSDTGSSKVTIRLAAARTHCHTLEHLHTIELLGSWYAPHTAYPCI